MKNLCTFLVFAILAVCVLGLYLDWFHFSSDSTDTTATFNLTVDKEKVKADEDKARQAMENAGQNLKEKVQEISGGASKKTDVPGEKPPAEKPEP